MTTFFGIWFGKEKIGNCCKLLKQIYDKKGQLKHKLTVFPGADKMREMIEALLP
jgi:hypothetical protein